MPNTEYDIARDPRWWQRHQQRWFPQGGANAISREEPSVDLLRKQSCLPSLLDATWDEYPCTTGRMPPDVLKRREGSFGAYLTHRNEVLPQPPTYIEKLNQLRSQQRKAKSRKPLPPLSPEKAPSCTPPAAPASAAPHSDMDLREMQHKLKLEIARRAKAKGFQPKREANIGPAVNLPLEKHMPPGYLPPFWTRPGPNSDSASGFAFFV